MSKKNLLAFILGGVVFGAIAFYIARRPAVPPTPAPAPAPQAAVQQPQQPAPQPQAAQPAPVQPAPVAAKPDTHAEKKTKTTKSAKAEAAPAPAQATAPPPVMQQAPPPEPAPQQAAVKHPEPNAIVKPDPVAEPAHRTPQMVNIPAGTTLTVRLRESIDTSRQAAGDTFSATIDVPLIIDGFVILEKGANVRGRITELERAGRVKGRAAVALELTQVHTSDGQQVAIRTAAYRNEAQSGAKGDVAKVGAASAIGAIIGAIAGGGKGAAIGAGVGGAAGAGGVLATKGSDVRLPSETRLSFKLTEAVTLTERLN